MADIVGTAKSIQDYPPESHPYPWWGRHDAALLNTDDGFCIMANTEALQKAALSVAETKPSKWVIPETMEQWNPQPVPTPYVPPYQPATGITSINYQPPKRDSSTELALSVIRRVINDTVKSILDEQDRKELELALAVIEGKK